MISLGKYSFVLAILWLGFVLAISFMEGPLKFLAPTLTREAAFDVGRIVFSALNKAEIVFASIIAIAFYRTKAPYKIKTVFVILLLILAAQTFWLLPELNQRSLLIIQGVEPEPSRSHAFYIVLEIVKVLGLMVMVFLQLRNYEKELKGFPVVVDEEDI